MTTPEPSTLSEQEAKDIIETAISRCDVAGCDGMDRLCSSCTNLRVLERAYAQARAARPSPWQPIETAPKDGTEFLMIGDGVYTIAWYQTGQRLCQLREDQVSQPTHWMPEPSPPAQDGGRP